MEQLSSERMTPEPLESRLATLLFGPDPVPALRSHEDFDTIHPRQFELFYARLLKRVEERLNQEFGGCLGLLQERFSLLPARIAKGFLTSPEFRRVREDLTSETETSEARFEIAFLNHALRRYPMDPQVRDEFQNLYLHELALSRA